MELEHTLLLFSSMQKLKAYLGFVRLCGCAKIQHHQKNIGIFAKILRSVICAGYRSPVR